MHFFLVGKVVVQKGCVSYQTLSVIFLYTLLFASCLDRIIFTHTLHRFLNATTTKLLLSMGKPIAQRIEIARNKFLAIPLVKIGNFPTTNLEAVAPVPLF
jgi:hypothetical protein